MTEMSTTPCEAQALKKCSVLMCDKQVKNGDCYCSMHRARLSRNGSLTLKTKLEKMTKKLIINKNTNCHEWTGFISKNGYGRFRVNGYKMLAHRYFYE